MYVNAFSVSCPEKSFIAFVGIFLNFFKFIESSLEKESWINSFKETQKEYLDWIQRIGNLNDSIQYLAPVWIPDNFSIVCMVCDSKFSWYNRKHHCR